MYKSMLKFFLIIAAAALMLSGCQPAATNTAVNNMPAPSPSTTPSPTPSPTETAADASAVTLPLLDAMLTDEEFVAKAKSEQNLSDEDIRKLREAAKSALQNLSDDGGGGDDTRSTKAAADEASKQLRAILGEDRAAKFTAFLNAQMKGADNAAAAPAPSSVPTDTRIVVNAPAYRMDVFKDGSLIKTYKIGIGYPEFPLPTGLRTARTIIFNPTWTPPDEPWVKGKVQAGRKVEAGSELNPLGPIKIPIGSPSLIHGGKSAARLGTFNSHGCVGLTTGAVQDLAMVLSGLSGQAMTMQEIKALEIAKTETKDVPLAQPIPVELRYETIVVENGVLKLYRDVYEKGTNTEANLRTVLSRYGVELDSLKADMRKKLLDGITQMSKDAGGNTVAATTATPTNTNTKSQSEKITANIKGKKELTFQLPELAGKGYPAPKNLKA